LGEKYTGFPSICASAGVASSPSTDTITDNRVNLAVILSSSRRGKQTRGPITSRLRGGPGGRTY